MKNIFVEKVTLNVGVGGPGDALDHAITLLTRVSGVHAVATKAGPSMRIPSWGVRPRLKIATKVTVRGEHAVALLKRLFVAHDSLISPHAFDVRGNFSFGIPEYIDIPGVEYDPQIGIIGLEAAVTLQRPGYRVKRRRMYQRQLPSRHRIGRDEAMAYITREFNVTIAEVREE